MDRIQRLEKQIADLERRLAQRPPVFTVKAGVKIRWVVVDKGNTLETSQDGVKYVADVSSVPSAYDPDVTSSFVDGIGRGTLFVDGIAQDGYVLIVNDDSGSMRNALVTSDVAWVGEPRAIPVGGGPQSVQAYPVG